MNNIFDLISDLRSQLENCRCCENDTEVMNAVETLNKIDSLAIKLITE